MDFNKLRPKELGIDIETFSRTPIEQGNFKYTNDPSFEILLLSYKIDDRPTQCIDLASGEEIPIWLIRYIKDARIIKRAWNAAFELACLSKYLNEPLDASQWRCTMVKAAYNGLPMKLSEAGAALKLDKKKLEQGKELIKIFCVPVKPTKANPYRLRNKPADLPEKWELFKAYNIRDVDVEYGIDKKIILKLPKRELKLYTIDQNINKRGIMVDLDLVNRVINIDEKYRVTLLNRAITLTGLSNPNSVKQLKSWIEKEIEDYVPSLDKDHVAKLNKTVKQEHVREILEIRKELALSSVKKFKRMLGASDESGCMRYLIQFYGAGRTGRWAGRYVQPHNLARNKYKYPELKQLRQSIKDGVDHEYLSMCYDSVSQCLKELIRPAFVPGWGKKFIIGDFSAIEAVVLAWLSGETWRLKAFTERKDIYKESYSRMYGIPVDKITDDQRQGGKVSELSLGYGGGVNALLQMAQQLGQEPPKEAGTVVARWRKASPRIVDSWYTAEKAFKYALLHPGEIVGCFNGKIKFQFFKGCMLAKLPSGRVLVYRTPELIEGQLSYYGQNQKTHRWERTTTWGGKIIENLTQAIARDLLAEAIIRVDDAGLEIVLHVHDEIITIVDESDTTAIKNMSELMTELPDWAIGMPVNVSAFEAFFYRK